jgi:membrane associated rhomboid family serine protease
MTPRNLATPSTLALFLATVATYPVQVLADDDLVERAVGLIPARVSNLATLMVVGGGQQVPAWLTLVTSMSPHGARWHVTMNMAGLWFTAGPRAHQRPGAPLVRALRPHRTGRTAAAASSR